MKLTGWSAEALVQQARQATPGLRSMSTRQKERILVDLAAQLDLRQFELLQANARDVEDARAAGRTTAAVDRLKLSADRIRAMAESVRRVAERDDPVGTTTRLTRRPNGMWVGRMRVPIGVILMVYEARPDVTVDAAAMCLKTGNAVILRGGSDARRTNAELGQCLTSAGYPDGAAEIVDPSDRALVIDLLGSGGIDLVIPRGGDRLIRLVTEHARMPVLKHFKGVCHLFIDGDADPAMSLAVVMNAKVQRPSTCNALETLLIDRPIAERILPTLVAELQAAGVEVRGCAETKRLAPVVPATDEDWGAEYLDLILAVRVVDGLDEAIAHVHKYSTGLADGIITNNHERAMRFVEVVDSAAVLVNTSTRLVDGGEFGLGAEIGISTARIGPRGPMGLKELTTIKWIVLGSGQVR